MPVVKDGAGWGVARLAGAARLGFVRHASSKQDGLAPALHLHLFLAHLPIHGVLRTQNQTRTPRHRLPVFVCTAHGAAQPETTAWGRGPAPRPRPKAAAGDPGPLWAGERRCGCPDGPSCAAAWMCGGLARTTTCLSVACPTITRLTCPPILCSQSACRALRARWLAQRTARPRSM